ncbi:MAG TPA: FecR family protein [Burkholderiales bacterium]|nr:FecR family protein [Burkholderiales bacterium]
MSIKNRILHCAALALLSACSLSALAAPTGKFLSVTGDVKASTQGKAAQAVAKGGALEPGMSVATGAKSSAILRFEDGQIIVLGSNSVFRIREYQFDVTTPAKNVLRFELEKGESRSITGLIGERNRENWRFDTPFARIEIRGTDFFAVVREQLYLHVNSGWIAADNSAGSAVFTDDQSAIVPNQATLAAKGSVPSHVFSEIESINLASIPGGSAEGAGAAGGTSWGTIGIVGGIGAAVVAGAIALGGGGGGSTTTHH